MQLIWFRQDLRINDNTALWYAKRSGNCIALVIISHKQWLLHNDADIKIDFYINHIKSLKKQLDRLNIPLIVRHVSLWENIPEIILELTQNLHINTIHANIEIGTNELKRDKSVQDLLENNKIVFELYHDNSLFPVGSILNLNNQPYKVFSAFKKKCYERLSLSLPSCYPEVTEQLIIQEHNFISEFDLLQKNNLKNLVTKWNIGEEVALNLLNTFIAKKVNNYDTERNFPSQESTSQLSPYLNLGVISIRQCIQALFDKQNGVFHIEKLGQQIWLDELLWREFYLHILFHFPHVSQNQPFKKNTSKIQWRHAPKDLIAWQTGQTGIPIIDAGMRQLLETGWMHNRIRMLTATFLTKNLLIDWRHGESWFMQNLIDGNLAANNGGWQWCASTGTDSSPYFRIFNPIEQSKKFDSNGDYIRKWVPELAHLDNQTIHDPYAKDESLVLNYPKPIADLKQSRIRAINSFKNI